jgi:glyoxylase-like metal-dependent hydrolase (beta-lactamase superfamily II)
MEIIQLTDWLWCLRTPLVQAYAVAHDRGVSVIDTSTAGHHGAILAALVEARGSSARLRLHEIFLTHGHDDHTGSAAGLAEATGARVLAPAAEADVVEGRRRRDAPTLRDWERPLFERIMPNVPAAPPVHVDGRLEAGDTLDWGRSGELIAAPGHTAGQLAVWFPADRVLVAGDAISSVDGGRCRACSTWIPTRRRRPTARWRPSSPTSPASAMATRWSAARASGCAPSPPDRARSSQGLHTAILTSGIPPSLSSGG